MGPIDPPSVPKPED